MRTGACLSPVVDQGAFGRSAQHEGPREQRLHGLGVWGCILGSGLYSMRITERSVQRSPERGLRAGACLGPVVGHSAAGARAA